MVLDVAGVAHALRMTDEAGLRTLGGDGGVGLDPVRRGGRTGGLAGERLVMDAWQLAGLGRRPDCVRSAMCRRGATRQVAVARIKELLLVVVAAKARLRNGLGLLPCCCMKSGACSEESARGDSSAADVRRVPCSLWHMRHVTMLTPCFCPGAGETRVLWQSTQFRLRLTCSAWFIRTPLTSSGILFSGWH